MNSLDYYTRQKEEWTTEEEEKVKREYGIHQMTVSEIADIHKRTPGSISSRLKKLGIILNMFSARGYEDYRKSSLYKEIVEKGTIKKVEKTIEKVEKKQSTAEKHQNNTIVCQIAELKSEVASIKKDVKEILRLINAIYDFESEN